MHDTAETIQTHTHTSIKWKNQSHELWALHNGFRYLCNGNNLQFVQKEIISHQFINFDGRNVFKKNHTHTK